MADCNLKGVGVALVTPFKKDFSIDFSALEQIINHIINGGCDYIVALGTTAETPTLSRDEKKEITKFIKDTVNGRLPLVLGIGGNNTQRVVNAIQTRDHDGYSAILSVAPFYNKPTQEGLFLHFKTICDASPLPVILYNVPTRTGVNISAKTTLRLSNYSDKIAGIKEASGNLEQVKEIIENAPSHFSVISGNDSDICSILKLGGKGVISVLANAFPNKVSNLVKLCFSQKFNDAQNYQENLSTIIGPLFEDGNPAGVKSVLANMGFLQNVLRLPLVPVSKNVEDKLKKEIALLGK